jgi:hypothetical protein
MHPFEIALSVSAENIEIKLAGYGLISWADYFLNPRRLRGSDFLMRWSQGAWSEQLLVKAVNENARYVAVPYGPSGVAPQDDPRAYEQYFERLEAVGLGRIKRPDLLIFKKEDEDEIQRIIQELGGAEELPFTAEDNPLIRGLLSRAVIAVECENSLWKGGKMPDYGKALTPQKRLGGALGLKKTAVVPTVIIKEEDRLPLRAWQESTGVPIHVWHVFFDLAFGLSLGVAEELVNSGKIQPTQQVFQAPGGATTKKIIYKYYYHYAYPLANATEPPNLVADHIEDKNGHILPYVKFEGGRLTLAPEALEVLDAACCTEEKNSHEDTPTE